MMRRLIPLALLILMSSFANVLNPVKQIKVTMETRSIKDGHMNKITSDIYYSIDGKMVSYFTFPKEFVSITNNKGEVKVYDVEKNEVYQAQNAGFNTETSQIYYFLNNKLSDLGLSSMGFQMSNTTFDEGLMVTEWSPPVEMAGQIGVIKLVHDRQIPIFMSYSDTNDKIVKKTFFYDYTNFDGISFPSTVTNINYMNAGDSSISKTSYSNILINEQVDKSKLNFEVPDNAKVIE